MQGYPGQNQQGYPAGYQGTPQGQSGAPPVGYPGQAPAGYAGQPPAGYAGQPPAGAVPAGAIPAGAVPAGAVPPGAPQGAGGDQPPAATAPPLEKMDQVAGYDNIGFTSSVMAPPSYDEAVQQGPPPSRGEVTSVPHITEEDARSALLNLVAQHCCYGKGAAEQMVITDLKSSSAFHYTLESFGESRSTSWAYEPFRNQVIDGPHNGPAPGPWDIQASPSAKFKNQTMHVEVPHTASVKPCHTCFSSGQIQCDHCLGAGRTFCHHCNGRGFHEHYHANHHGDHHHGHHHHGHHHHQHCTWCEGTGRSRCHKCNGFGRVKCHTCQGACNLKCYIKLTINWKNHLSDYIVERTALPDHLIRNVQGQVAFTEEQPRVWPINHFPDQTINQNSQRLVREHSTGFPTERILMQRHQVRIIPVTEAMYKWKNTNSNFFVYGFEHAVHAPDYPQQCCCGCTIL